MLPTAREHTHPVEGFLSDTQRRQQRLKHMSAMKQPTHLFRLVQHKVHVLVEPEDLSFYPHLCVLVKPDLNPRSLRENKLSGRIDGKSDQARGEDNYASEPAQKKKGGGGGAVEGTTAGGDQQDRRSSPVVRSSRVRLLLFERPQSVTARREGEKRVGRRLLTACVG